MAKRSKSFSSVMAEAAKPTAKPAWLIYSTISNGTKFCKWVPGPNKDLNVLEYSVSINGGAGVMRKHGLITPLGVKTEITQEQMDFLETNENYKRMVDGGWLTAIKISGWQDDPDVIAADMNQRDGSSPYVPADLEEGREGNTGKVSLRSSNYRPRSKPMAPLPSAFR